MAFEEMRSARAAERKIADGVNDLGLSVSAGTGSFLERASHREGNEQRRQRPPPHVAPKAETCRSQRDPCRGERDRMRRQGDVKAIQLQPSEGRARSGASQTNPPFLYCTFITGLSAVAESPPHTEGVGRLACSPVRGWITFTRFVPSEGGLKRDEKVSGTGNFLTGPPAIEVTCSRRRAN